jgi:hypothetical protein
MTVVVVGRADEYVLNHCTRFLARDRGPIAEPFHFPVIDTHWDGQSAEESYRFNDVTFVYDASGSRPTQVRVVGSFGALYDLVPLRSVDFLGEATGLWAVTVRVPKGQVHSYKFVLDAATVTLDPVNPQRTRLDNGEEWSRFFTHGCAVPISFEPWEARLLERIVAQLLPFQVEENRRFVAEQYNALDRQERDARFPLAYRMDESVGVVNFLDKLLAREEAHNLDDYRTCLRLIDAILRGRHPGREPADLGRQVFLNLYAELTSNAVAGWSKEKYGDPAYFLLLLRRHTMTGAFAHPKHGGNAGAIGWAYLQERFPFAWQLAVEAPLGDNRDYRG